MTSWGLAGAYRPNGWSGSRPKEAGSQVLSGKTRPRDTGGGLASRTCDR